MTSAQIVKSYIDFFVQRGHKEIPSAFLVPENDPTVLFTTAGMHPLVPYLLGQPHPLGKRLVDLQKCLRTDDIEEVGDESHLTYFEMLGNWSLGDYFKKEAISWSFEFITKILKIPQEKLFVTCFEGDKDAPRDEESAKIWESQGVTIDHVFFYPKSKNWWGPAGITGPCGPDTEMFYDTGREHKKEFGENCHPNCQCGKYVEFWNDVFMEYNKTEDNKFIPLNQKNVDTGMGLERIAMVVQEKNNVFETDIFAPIINKIKSLSPAPNERSIRIIADHLRASVNVIAEGVLPSNNERGYVLRRLLRRAIRHCKLIGIDVNQIVKSEIIEEEAQKFNRTLDRGLKEFEKISTNSKDLISGKDAFLLYESYGFPIELTTEMAKEINLKVDLEGYKDNYKMHQDLSRTVAKEKFKGGLADQSEITTKYHTATHLLHQALRTILGSHVSQKGSNITSERLRFDFSQPTKLTDEEINKVKELVNKKIKENLKVEYQTMPVEDALTSGALAFFGNKYPNIVKVYKIGDFSKEICGGPHVFFTGELKSLKITKEESAGSGIRRIYAVLGE